MFGVENIVANPLKGNHGKLNTAGNYSLMRTSLICMNYRQCKTLLSALLMQLYGIEDLAVDDVNKGCDYSYTEMFHQTDRSMKCIGILMGNSLGYIIFNKVVVKQIEF